jgi:hypothetical protein
MSWTVAHQEGIKCPCRYKEIDPYPFIKNSASDIILVSSSKTIIVTSYLKNSSIAVAKNMFRFIRLWCG